jgi:site-specific recombinase XerD
VHHLAKTALYFNRLPTEIDADQINDYLYFLQQTGSPSQSFFKFAVYSLRLCYRIDGMPEKFVQLPSIKHEKKLPIVLSREEIRRLLATPRMLKHRVVMGLLYGCGLRCFEVRHIQLPDVDFDRKMLHVRCGKGNKERYVPISQILIDWMQEYIEVEKPDFYLFSGRSNGRDAVHAPYSPKGLGWVIRHSARQAGIIKRVSAHTLRHTFATHLLEDGLDIVSIKNLLGHSNIETTLVYLHVAHYERVKSFSPLDTVYGIRKRRFFEADEFDGNARCSMANHLMECEDCRKVGFGAV